MNLTIQNLEVTQAIQYLGNPNEADNSLPLVRGKRTFVRMYVGVSGALGSVSGVDGQLRVFVEGTELAGSPFASENGPISAPVTPDRGEVDHTLNFQFLVPETGFGSGAVSVDFEAEVNHDGSVAETSTGDNTMELNDVTFECHRSPSIAYVPIDYTYDGESDPDETGEPDASMIRPGIGDDYIWHSYPIPEPPDYYKASVPAVEWDEDVDSTPSDLLTELETTRTMLTPQPDFIYGWLPGNPYGGNGRAAGIGTGNAAFGNTEDIRYQRTFAHEIGHLLGLSHKLSTVSPEVGFYSSYPVERIRVDACDSTGDQRTKCGDLKDFMDAGEVTSDAWIDAETYTFLANHDLIADHECPALIFPDLPFLDYYFITGTIVRRANLGSHSLNPVYRLKGPKELTRDNPDGTRRIELRSEDGKVVFGLNFEVSFFGDDSDEPTDQAPFALAVPAKNDRAVASVVLLSEGEEVAGIERSPNPPEVAIRSPQPGQTLEEQVLVSWEADDADDDPLRFSLQYSPDGETFLPLAVNRTETEFRLDTSEIPGSQRETALLRVIATDGFNTTIEQVTRLTVPRRKPPTVRITEPKVGAERTLSISRGQPLILSGHAYDMEDGFLSGEALLWASSQDGKLGTGRTLQVNNLSAGQHTISLVGIDGDQNQVEDSIVVNVVE